MADTEVGALQTRESHEVLANGDSLDKPPASPNDTENEDTFTKQVLPRRSSLIKDTSARKNVRKKTVSFSSMPSEKTIANAHDCLNMMKNGCELIKVRSNSRQYPRFFSIDNDLTEIRWQPSSKKPHKARIPIDMVKEVRAGKNTEILRSKDIACLYPDECAFAVIYGDGYESLDLVAPTPEEANVWVTGLTCLVSGKTSKSPDAITERTLVRDRWLEEMFQAADQDKCGYLDEFEVITVMKKLNNEITTAKVQQKLKELDLSKNEEDRGKVTVGEFVQLYIEMSTRPEIYFLLVRYANNRDCMSVDDLLLFLEAEQGKIDVGREECLRIIQKYEPSSEGKEHGYLGIDGFQSYLLSDECDVFDPDQRVTCMDMSQPLCHYFIASSHNTYLLEDQLKGPSGTGGYIRALKKACRCIEMDVWDGINGDPVIYHGHTLTSKIPFRSVIEAIHEHAFDATEYPLIICLENHCSPVQQDIMVQCLTSVFGDKLYTKPLDVDILPSPEALRGRILIKGKKLPPDYQENEGYVTDEDEAADSDKRKNNKHQVVTKQHILTKDLSDLICLRSVRFDDLTTASNKQKVNELWSLNEAHALRLASSVAEELVKYNKTYLSRVYPSGARVDSSNFNPQDFWNCGCQIVSMNFQTPSIMMDLHDARFKQNGCCGYVLKPALMRDTITYFNAHTRDSIPGITPQILHIKIISGHQFPKPKASGAKGDVTDPYVIIEVFGIPADCSESRTRTISNNGYNPVFDESFDFDVNLPELALVRFTILDDEFIGDEFIAQYTIPLECIRTGYRHIRLLSNIGDPIPNCSLFVHIAITNRRGGGKPHRRGTSVKKGYGHKTSSSMKLIGVKSLDELFKPATQTVMEAVVLRDNVQQELSEFKEACGLSQISNIKQCVRLLATRKANLGEDLALELTMEDEYPFLEITDVTPDIISKAILAMNSLVGNCRIFKEEYQAVHQKLLACHQAGLESHEDLGNKCQQAGLKGKKLAKAAENFAWNIRLLKGQADLLVQSADDCSNYVKQIHDSITTLGFLKNGADSCTQSSAINGTHVFTSPDETLEQDDSDSNTEQNAGADS